VKKSKSLVLKFVKFVCETGDHVRVIFTLTSWVGVLSDLLFVICLIFKTTPFLRTIADLYFNGECCASCMT
jgi:hypothetical protein